MSQEIRTQLPPDADESRVLEFDQNFECGNIDSVYFQANQEYNLLMKVDTNTKGNTYWFKFRVRGFKAGSTYKFNICNFSRNMETFYKQGMNIFTRAEKPPESSVEIDHQGKMVKGKRKASGNSEYSEFSEPISADSNSNYEDLKRWNTDRCKNVEYFPDDDKLVRITKRHPETGEIQWKSYW